MAGDWLKVEICTPDKPEIFSIAAELDLDPDVVFARLFRFWVWADQQTECNAFVTQVCAVDHVVGVKGFADALQKVGWLVPTKQGFELPNFNRHNGKTAKKRAQTLKRVKRNRNADGVTKALPEKRREEKKSKPKEKFVAPTVDQVEQYSQEYSETQKLKGKSWPAQPFDADAFTDHYEANGWKQSNGNPIKNWKAAVQGWGRRKFQNNSAEVDTAERIGGGR